MSVRIVALKKGVRHMTSDFAKNMGLAHKVISAGELVGFTPAQWNALAENPTLFDAIHDVVLGHAEIKPIEHLIDCDAAPFTQSGWKVEKHQKGGQFKWDSAQVALYLSEFQKNGVIDGNKLRNELAGKPVMNACVLDYLLAHPNLIPEKWKGKYVFFWGTIYRDSDGYLYVRYLGWYGDGWGWRYRWLGDVWSGDGPAALRAS